MIKIIHILTDSNIGGAGKLLYNLTSCIEKKRFEFVFVFSKNSSLIELFRPFGLRIYALSNGADRSFDIKNVQMIRSIIKKENPDIVHTHSSLSGRIASRLAGISVNHNVYTRHCVFGVPHFMQNPISKMIYRMIDDSLSANVIAVAEAARDELVNFGVQPNKISVIINGSKALKRPSESKKRLIREELGIKNGEFAVVISARLEKYKGHRYFLEAAAIALKKRKNIKFFIMGEGSYGKNLENYAKRLGVYNKNVYFLGFVKDVYRYMSVFDVNVNCSTGTETSSLAVSEGLSIGMPAIVSDFGGNPNMVKDGVTGFVVKKADPIALYNAIIKLNDDRDMYEKMSKNAEADFWKRFSDIKMAVKYEKLYEEIISK